jgi:threonine/homoserine/homoserine lactone efflux protein
LAFRSFIRNFATEMPFVFHIDIVNLVFKGILIGIIASAPMGPVGILCIQRTLNKGRWYGFVTGIGAAVSDILYAMITGLGMSVVVDMINDSHTQFLLQILGSIILLFFGLFCFRSDPTKNMHRSGHQKGSLFHNGLTAFLVTFSNPLIIFLFMALFAQFSFVVPNHPLEMMLGFLSIPFGALLWWYGLTWIVDKVRAFFNIEGIIIINKVIGSLVILFSVIILFGTVFNLYKLPHY